ncbi:hypothetical protein QCA50_003028 [Cerrena zonata]|uniref:USP domain-containing protein n=1 Tax=Cerrena zonata TaxID=2478898 RepID=A0AAW0GVI2_9APHY
MPVKRTRRSPPPSEHTAGERLKRAKLAGNDFSNWGWVDHEVTDASHITQEHRLVACGLSKYSPHPFCPNRYVQPDGTIAKKEKVAAGELEDDIIVISDDESTSCNTKSCKNNPNCLNNLGQEKWEDEDKAFSAFMKIADLGENPLLYSRDPGLPIGLKNLGATCYANAFLQVWFQDLPFRRGVYSCLPAAEEEMTFEESPIFQLQVTFAAMQESILSALIQSNWLKV